MVQPVRKIIIGFSRFNACILLAVVPSLLFADTLTTQHYVVTITVHCAEGSVTCDNVSYHGKSRNSGHEIKLVGTTVHSLCADGLTPCRFIGYRFPNGDVTYTVYESGLLEVVRGADEILVEEFGEWTY
jgi:hypothetical protein